MTDQTPVEALSRIFGSQRGLAQAAGVAESLPSRWKSRSSPTQRRGHIPSRYNQRILQAARTAGLSQRRVKQWLDRHTCPACGQNMPAGVTVAQVMANSPAMKGK